jgi:hypothetical protein
MNPLVNLLAGPVFESVNLIIDKIWPDKEKYALERQKAELELLRFTQSERMQDKANEVALAVAQMDINKVEAAHTSLFVSGWRPFIGWVCGVSFAYIFFLGPLITAISASYGYSFMLPPIDIDKMIYILGGILGLGGLRTFEKVKGVAAK